MRPWKIFLLIVLFEAIGFALRFAGPSASVQSNVNSLVIGAFVSAVELFMSWCVYKLLRLTDRLLVTPTAAPLRRYTIRLGYVIFAADAVWSTWQLVLVLHKCHSIADCGVTLPHLALFTWDFTLVLVPVCFMIGMTRTPLLGIIALSTHRKRILDWTHRQLGCLRE